MSACLLLKFLKKKPCNFGVLILHWVLISLSYDIITLSSNIITGSSAIIMLSSKYDTNMSWNPFFVFKFCKCSSEMVEIKTYLYNGLSPGRSQAIIWTNTGILLTRPQETNFNEILIKMHTFSFKKIHFKMSGKWWPICFGPNVLISKTGCVFQKFN